MVADRPRPVRGGDPVVIAASAADLRDRLATARAVAASARVEAAEATVRAVVAEARAAASAADAMRAVTAVGRARRQAAADLRQYTDLLTVLARWGVDIDTDPAHALEGLLRDARAVTAREARRERMEAA